MERPLRLEFPGDHHLPVETPQPNLSRGIAHRQTAKKILLFGNWRIVFAHKPLSLSLRQRL